MIKVNDVVKLASGGPPLMVLDTAHGYSMVCWFDDQFTIMRGTFPNALLVIVP